MGADGAPVAQRREVRQPASQQGGAPKRSTPREFLHEVNVEMRKVAWPTKAETMNYSAVVLVTLIVVIALNFGLDYVFSAAARFLFK